MGTTGSLSFVTVGDQTVGSYPHECLKIIGWDFIWQFDYNSAQAPYERSGSNNKTCLKQLFNLNPTVCI